MAVFRESTPRGNKNGGARPTTLSALALKHRARLIMPIGNNSSDTAV
jgi:hypothetical protein